MRSYLLGLFAILLCGLWWYLDTLLATQGWATMADDKWTLISDGWGILLSAWPLALVGVLIGGIAAIAMVLIAWQYAEDKDHLKEMTTLQEQLMAAEIRATEAVANAEQRVQAREQAATRLKQQAERDMTWARQVELQAKKEVLAAQEEVEKADLRARNAIAVGLRKTKRFAKLQDQVSDPSC